MELCGIKTAQEIAIDFKKVLNVKKGDLCIIQGEVFRCTPHAQHLNGVSLVVKRLECIDRRVYDLKIYESDMFMRFRGHANIVSLYSYWSEPSTSPYVYKVLVQLYEEGTFGDLLKTVVMSPIRPSNRVILKYVCDISKALVSIHNAGIVHGGVKPSNIYLSRTNDAMLGEFKKVELDSARNSQQLFSKVLVGMAIPRHLIYWAPEVVANEKYGSPADLWALGIAIYQMMTGEHPFNVKSEEKFRSDVQNARVDWSKFPNYPRLRNICENLLRAIADKRWTALQVLSDSQIEFAIDIQRIYRGHQKRLEFKRRMKALVKIQALVKAWLSRLHYHRDKLLCRDTAAMIIQKRFRAFQNAKNFIHTKRALMKCQANVLARQIRRSFLKLKIDTIIGQALIRRYLSFTWFQRVQQRRRDLENHMENINEMIQQYNYNAKDFKGNFSKGELAGPLKYLESFEDYEMTKAKVYGSDKSNLPNVVKYQSEIEKVKQGSKQANFLEEEKQAEAKKGNFAEFNEEELKKELGERYTEYKPMMDEIKKNLKRVSDLAAASKPLNIRIQHPYTYSKWDQIHEPYNVVENVLKDDETVYRAINPLIDLTLGENFPCFIADIWISPGECGPGTIEIYTSNFIGKWNLVKSYQCTRDPLQKFILPGEQTAKYLRIKSVNNIRGGNIVSIRRVEVKGIKYDR